jgi:hypothetical protein
MIILPIIGAISAATAATWVIGGAVSGVCGWLVRKVLKVNARAEALDARIEKLEQ